MKPCSIPSRCVEARRSDCCVACSIPLRCVQARRSDCFVTFWDSALSVAGRGNGSL